MTTTSAIALSATPETEGRGIAPENTRRLSAVEVLRLLKRQCQASRVERHHPSAVECATNSAYGQIATWIELWLTEDAEDREKSRRAEETAIEAIVHDERRKFDNADELICHIFNMTREQPTYGMQKAMWLSIHLFADDYLTQKKEQ